MTYTQETIERSTWFVTLWVDNDQATYRKKMFELRKLEEVDATAARRIAAACGYPQGKTPDHSKDYPPSAIDWDDIAEDWETERKEDEAYR